LTRTAATTVRLLVALLLVFMIFKIFLSIYGSGGVYDRLLR
jgi:hypothetical protein